MVPRDKRVLGQTGTLYERGVDFDRLRRERLIKVQVEMEHRDIGALVLTDILNIRYTTGVSVMPIWTATNLAHYVIVPVTGDPIIFEFLQAKFRAEEFFDDVRVAHFWQARFSDQLAPEKSAAWAAEVDQVLRELGLKGTRVGIDNLDFYGFTALQQKGLALTDADEPMEAARKIKTADEIELLRQSAAVCEAALFGVERATVPGVTENELLGTFLHKLLSLGGEHCSTRLLVSGSKTNPWFQEAGSKVVRPGDLVAIDTDMVGPEGYMCDISRTFLCGDEPSSSQKGAYRAAHEFIMSLAEMLKPGLSYEELIRNVPQFPDEYKKQRYPVILHGIGTDDEFPFVPYIDREDSGNFLMPEGELEENMVVSVESYAGTEGEQDGVKLEDEVWLTSDGPVIISLYPYDQRLLQ